MDSMANVEPTVTITEYLLSRLRELGVDHLFGVPGDYNLVLLDDVLDTPGMEWVGTAAELGAAYAADGYARVRGFGALLTTFGVGELSAINGVAGSFAERVPLLHLTVGPAQAMEDAEAVVHHTAGDGDFSRFARAHESVTCAQGVLRADNAAAEIDRVLIAALGERRPGYLRMPSDVGRLRVPAPRQPLPRPEPDVDAAELARFVDVARDRVATAGSMAVLADFLADRFGARKELEELVSIGLPHAVVSMGKTVLDEDDPYFVGVYAGALSDDLTRATIDDAELLVRVGVHFSDTTSGGFSQGFADDAGIALLPRTARVDGKLFDLPLVASLSALVDLVRKHHEPAPPPIPASRSTSIPNANDALTQEFLWDTVAASLTNEDVVVAEQGTSFFGIASRRFPGGSRFIAQPLWGSIGYSLPALLGAQLADSSRRGLLLIGDGSAQMTIQELGTIVRQKLTPVILLVNNGGYTVERAIHGARAAYNDIAPWDWPALPAALGASDALVRTVKTNRELAAALDLAREATDRLVVIEAITGMDDVPVLLRRLVGGVSRRNS